MVTYKKQLQSLFHDYEKHHGGPGPLRDAVRWGLEQGRLVEPTYDPIAALVSEMKDALRSETRIDANGREYRANAAITFTEDGSVQGSLWGDVDLSSTSDEFLIEHFAQRRKGVADVCVKLKDDHDHCALVRPSMSQLPLILDFTEDVAERQAARHSEKAAE